MYEPKPVKQLDAALRYGGLAACISILHSVVLYVMEWETGGWLSSLIQVGILILFIVLAIQYYRDLGSGGFIKYGRAFGTGVLTALIYSIIAAVYFFVFITFIDTTFIAEILDDTRKTMEEREMSDEEIEESLKYTRWFVNEYTMPVWALLGSMFWGTLVSLVVAAFMHKRNPMEGVRVLDADKSVS
jgi:hypothetical protein